MKLKNFVFLALLAALFAFAYLQSAYLLPQSQVSFHARLMTTSPFVYRLLIPYSLGLILPTGWLDSDSLKYAFAFASVFLTLYLMPSYARRMCGLVLSGPSVMGLQLLAMVVLVSHFCLPRPFMFYYIYDLPAIVFYLAAFLLLTRQARRLSWSGVAFLLLASLNRETVVIALFHALAWHVAQGPSHRAAVSTGGASRWAAYKPVLLQSAVAVALMVLLRGVVSHVIQAAGDGSAAFMERDQIRVLINIKRVLAYDFHARALLFFGCGAVAWLPWGVRRWPRELKLVAWASVVPMGILLVVGNMVELRIYSEFVPVLALGLHLTLARFFGKFRGEPAAERPAE
jgi:hypothetical protein